MPRPDPKLFTTKERLRVGENLTLAPNQVDPIFAGEFRPVEQQPHRVFEAAPGALPIPVRIDPESGGLIRSVPPGMRTDITSPRTAAESFLALVDRLRGMASPTRVDPRSAPRRVETP